MNRQRGGSFRSPRRRPLRLARRARARRVSAAPAAPANKAGAADAAPSKPPAHEASGEKSTPAAGPESVVAQTREESTKLQTRLSGWSFEIPAWSYDAVFPGSSVSRRVVIPRRADLSAVHR